MPSSAVLRSSIVLALAACAVACASDPPAKSASASSASSAPASSASTDAPTASKGGPSVAPGAYTYAEACGAQGTVTSLEIGPTGKVKIAINGYQAATSGSAHLVPEGDGYDVVVDAIDADSTLPRWKVGDRAVRFRVQPDGSLLASDPPGNCTVKSGTFYAAGKEPPSKIVRKTTTCRPGTTASSAAGGCICDGTSVIANPCSAGGGTPEVKGNQCFHVCAER